VLELLIIGKFLPRKHDLRVLCLMRVWGVFWATMSGRLRMTKRIGVCEREFLGFYAGGREGDVVRCQTRLISRKSNTYPLTHISA